jgi:hypothetical protein
MEKITKQYTYTVPIHSKRVKCRVPNYVCKHVWKSNGKLVSQIHHQAGWKDEYEFVIIGYQKKVGVQLIGYNLIWWSDKDIGIDFVLRQRGI